MCDALDAARAALADIAPTIARAVDQATAAERARDTAVAEVERWRTQIQPGVAGAVALLEREGYTVHRTTYHQALQRRQAITEARRDWAERETENTRAWARDCLAEERRLRERCAFLYGAAMARGATHEDLTPSPPIPPTDPGEHPHD